MTSERKTTGAAGSAASHRGPRSDTNREHADWLASNREAIAGYNDAVRVRGVFSDDWRRF